MALLPVRESSAFPVRIRSVRHKVTEHEPTWGIL